MLCSFEELQNNIVDPKRALITRWKVTYLSNHIDIKNTFTMEEQAMLSEFDKLVDERVWSKIKTHAQKIVEKLG